MRKKISKPILFVSLSALAAAIAACGLLLRFLDNNDVKDIMPMTVPLAESPPMFFTTMPAAQGDLIKKNDRAEIDYSNTGEGYVMIRYYGRTDKLLKVIIEGSGGVSYTYALRHDGEYEVFPLSDGNGKYRIGIYENINGKKYATVLSLTTDVMLNDEFAPFLRPNQYVNYSAESQIVSLAAELTQNCGDMLEKVSSVYNYVIENITYDKELAVSVESGYIPDVDAVLKKGTGICFDYAAVTTAMLRSLTIPTKLVVGYTGSAYHAWINVYSEETGWIDSVIYFDGSGWKLMDPTLSAGSAAKDDIKKYIGDGKNYTAKYLY